MQPRGWTACSETRAVDENELVDRVIKELRRRFVRYLIVAVVIGALITYGLGWWDLPSWLNGPGPDASTGP